ncbi:Zn-dependent protease with chaperone function [Rubidibacter lacunae KORDI 51-2]|uniref:Zn-dependent protease with chaperone function n=1 Tax=Rubidibacter lacunae KORDI 51-2 TaxID=582515 RepID=U5DHK7_9CHRO|nr:M56 family metallopeptidase [Rubidibacter lacunae]ERN41096.1 Zn-dependent protease with chaperone function [Rubidibacter lacunae KORDI 51-2]
MHLVVLAVAIAIAWCWRAFREPGSGSLSERWLWALTDFAMPPALVLVTAIAVAVMGADGQMFGFAVGWLGAGSAIALLAWAASGGLRQAIALGRLRRRVRSRPYLEVSGLSGAPCADSCSVRQLDLDAPFAAAIAGEITVSRGLTALLTPEQLAVVLVHECGHLKFRDPLWFAGLGWVRWVSAWLPNTYKLWEELLCLRELRADRWATQYVDPLLLAETLLLLAQQPLPPTKLLCAALSGDTPPSRLAQRISALMAASDKTAVAEESQKRMRWSIGAAWSPLLLPLLVVPFHS